MHESRVDDLIQCELDGVLSETESAELRSVTGSDPNVAAERKMMQQIAGALDTLPVAEPPAGFAESVMARVRAGQAPRLAAVLPFRTRRGAIAAIAVAATAIVGVLFVPYISERMDEGEFRGAILPPAAGTPQFEVPERHGAITIAADERTVELRVAVDARAGDRIALRYDDSLLDPAGATGGDTVQSAAGALTLAPRGGSAALRFARESPRATAIELSYYSGERLLVRRTIEVPAITNF